MRRLIAFLASGSGGRHFQGELCVFGMAGESSRPQLSGRKPSLHAKGPGFDSQHLQVEQLDSKQVVGKT